MITRSKRSVQTAVRMASALFARNRQDLTRVLVSYRTFSQRWAFRPGMARERDLFFHALLTSSWDSGVDKVVSPQELSGMAARQLRLLYERSDDALTTVRADAATHGAAARSIEILKEIGTERNRPLLLETLFIAENMATGPQHFDHAFEIEERFI